MVDGLVEQPLALTLAELRALPSRTQITRHDCVEGWSSIGKWKGARLGPLLDRAELKPEARYIVFHCADTLEQTLDGTGQYYESIDLIDAYHPQTILAYEMNDAPLPVRARRAAAPAGRAPARLQARQVRHADRGGGSARPASAAARAASGRTAATSGTRGSEAPPPGGFPIDAGPTPDVLDGNR